MAIEAARLQAVVTADTGPAERELRGFGAKASRTLGSSMSTAGQSAGSALGTAMKGALVVGLGGIALGATVGRAIFGGISGALQSYADQESLKRQLQSMVGMELVDTGAAENFAEGYGMAADKAGELYEWVRKLAIQSPFSSDDVSGVMSVGMTMGFTADETQRMTQGLVDWAAAMGRSGPEMEGVARAIGQIGMKGKVSMEELQQMGERGVPALQILADEAGKTTGEMQKLIETGDVDVDWAQETLLAYFDTFQGAAEEAGGTWAGLLASLGDIKEFAATDFLGPTFQALQPAVQGIVDALLSPGFQDAIRSTGEQLGSWAAIKLDGLAGTVREIVNIWAPIAEGPVKPAIFSEEPWTWSGLPDPDPELEKADKWSQTFAVIMGWDADAVQFVLDRMFPAREGAQERRFEFPDPPSFEKMSNWQQFIDGLSRGNDAGDIGNAILGAIFNVDMVGAQEKLNAQMKEFWTGLPGRVVEWLNETAASIGTWFSSLGTKAADWLKEGWGAFTAALGQSWEDAKALIGPIDWLTVLNEGLAAVWEGIKVWFTLPEQLPRPVVDWTGLQDGLSEAWESVKKFVRDNVLDVVVNLLPDWGGGGMSVGPIQGGGAINPNLNYLNPGEPIVSPYIPPYTGPPVGDDGFYDPQSMRLPAMAGGGRGNIIITGNNIQQPLDMMMLANTVAKMMKQGRV
jgi:tape measure domain-containing protein